jgi:hypothetical protein
MVTRQEVVEDAQAGLAVNLPERLDRGGEVLAAVVPVFAESWRRNWPAPIAGPKSD